MDFRAQEVEPFEQPVALNRTMGRRESRFRRLVSKVLGDDGTVTQKCAVLQWQEENVTKIGDIGIARPVRQQVARRGDRDDVGILPTLVQYDADGLRTASRHVILLHAKFL